MRLEYIIILVDKPSDEYVRPFENDFMKVEVIPKGRQMVGLRFKSTRPTMVIDAIQDRTLVTDRGEEIFEKWWTHCVLPNASRAEIIKKKDLTQNE